MFSQVEIAALPQPALGVKPRLESTLETIAIGSKDRRVVYHTTNHIEAPNWMRDGRSFLFNGNGHIYQLPVTGGSPQLLDTGLAVRCNNDHGLSPNGTRLAISDQTEERKSLIYLLPATGGAPRRITRTSPSYWHGWSPDGKTLAFCGERNGNFDIYTISTDGGEEQRLTTAEGLDDGPEYSPDGKFIYFNSERTGSMQIWRMKPDGSGQEPVTSDEYATIGSPIPPRTANGSCFSLTRKKSKAIRKTRMSCSALSPPQAEKSKSSRNCLAAREQ